MDSAIIILHTIKLFKFVNNTNNIKSNAEKDYAFNGERSPCAVFNLQN